MKNLTKKSFLSVVFSLIACFAFSNFAFAEDDTLKNNTIGISPTVKRIELDPGASYTNNFVVTNNGANAFEFEIGIGPYFVEGREYTPVYSTKSTYNQIVNWITVDTEEGTLDPGESAIINYTIDVPEDAPGGGQYAAIFASTRGDSTDEDTVGFIGSVGMIISSRISGSTRVSGDILDSKVNGFLLTPPITATTSIENTGNVDQDVTVKLRVANYFSNAEVYSNESNPETRSVLPGTTRDLKLTWEKTPRLGIFRVTLTTEFVDNAEIINRVVIVCPIWLIVILIAIVIIFIAMISMKKHDNSKKRSNSRGYDAPSKGFNI